MCLAMLYLVKKNAIPDDQKCRFINGEKIEIFQRGPWFLSKIEIVSFWTCYVKKKVFNNVPKSKQTILEEKNLYLGMVIKTDLFQRG